MQLLGYFLSETQNWHEKQDQASNLIYICNDFYKGLTKVYTGLLLTHDDGKDKGLNPSNP